MAWRSPGPRSRKAADGSGPSEPETTGRRFIRLLGRLSRPRVYLNFSVIVLLFVFGVVISAFVVEWPIYFSVNAQTDTLSLEVESEAELAWTFPEAIVLDDDFESQSVTHLCDPLFVVPKGTEATFQRVGFGDLLIDLVAKGDEPIQIGGVTASPRADDHPIGCEGSASGRHLTAGWKALSPESHDSRAYVSWKTQNYLSVRVRNPKEYYEVGKSVVIQLRGQVVVGDDLSTQTSTGLLLEGLARSSDPVILRSGSVAIFGARLRGWGVFEVDKHELLPGDSVELAVRDPFAASGEADRPSAFAAVLAPFGLGSSQDDPPTLGLGQLAINDKPGIETVLQVEANHLNVWRWGMSGIQLKASEWFRLLNDPDYKLIWNALALFSAVSAFVFAALGAIAALFDHFEKDGGDRLKVGQVTVRQAEIVERGAQAERAHSDRSRGAEAERSIFEAGRPWLRGEGGKGDQNFGS